MDTCEKGKAYRNQEKRLGEEHIVKGVKWLIGSLVLAFLAAISIFVVLVSMERKMLADFEKEKVWVVAKPLLEGQRITEELAQQSLEQREIDKGAVSEDAILDLAGIIGKKVRIPLTKGMVIARSELIDVNEVEASMKEPVLVGVRVEDLYQVVGGVIREGDQIHIYSVEEETGEVYIKWERLQVADTFDASGNRIEKWDNEKNATRFNVYLEKADVESFYEGLSARNMWAALACE